MWDTCGAGHQPMYVSSYSCFIDKARNLLWDAAKEEKADYLLFLDSDIACANPFNENIIKQLIELDKDVVVGLYVDKRPPFRVHIYNFTADGKMMNCPTWSNEPFKVDAGPTGFMLISKRVMDAFTEEAIKKVGKPFSYLGYGEPWELGEDVSFCKRIKQLGFELWVDPRIKLAHFGKQPFTTEHYELAKQNAAEKFENGIQGWMAPIELEFLWAMGNKYKTCVEIGPWKGRSTKALLDSKLSKVFAVDTWEGSQDPRDLTFEMAKKEDIFAEFKKNVGHYDSLKTIKKSSQDAARQFSDKSVDMVFIDAEHTYEGVKSDIESWLPKVKRLICGHDYSDVWSGVKKAVDEKFGDKVRCIASIWYVEL